jgi:hypothetical protein
MIKKIFNQSELVKLGVFFTIFFFVLFAFNLPFAKRVDNFYLKLSSEEQKLAAQYKAGSSLEKARADYQALAERIPEAKDIFSKSGEELKLITDLEHLAAAHNLTQKLNLSPSTIKYSDQLEALTLELSLQGNFNNLVAYLDDLAKRHFSLNVSGISLTKLDQDLLEIKLLTNTYWLTMALKSPKLNMKFFYTALVVLILAMIALFGLTTYKKYRRSFNLSENINKYLESISLKEVEKTKAEVIIKFLTATSSAPLNLAGVKNPFAPLPVEEKKEKK